MSIPRLSSEALGRCEESLGFDIHYGEGGSPSHEMTLQERSDKATAYNLMWSLPGGPDSWPESPAVVDDGPAWLQVRLLCVTQMRCCYCSIAVADAWTALVSLHALSTHTIELMMRHMAMAWATHPGLRRCPQ